MFSETPAIDQLISVSVGTSVGTPTDDIKILAAHRRRIAYLDNRDGVSPGVLLIKHCCRLSRAALLRRDSNCSRDIFADKMKTMVIV